MPVQHKVLEIYHEVSKGGVYVHTYSTCAAAVYRDTLTRMLQPFRYLHSYSGCFRLEQVAERGLHPLENAAFARGTPEAAARDWEVCNDGTAAEHGCDIPHIIGHQ